jgi:hypothetical protein
VRNGEFYFEYFFGTSAAAPDMAGIAALLNSKYQAPQGELNQRLYYLAASPALKVFNDVTVATSGVSGCVVTTPSMCNNSTPSPSGLTGGLSGYLVSPGFDEVTGLGSINVDNMLTNWYAGFPATTTLLVSSLNPAYLGQSVTFTATVTTAGANPPTGKVTFSDPYPFGSANLSTVNGVQVATLTTSALYLGPNYITAYYSGDAHNADSTSQQLTENLIAPTFTWTANGSTSGSVLSGQSVVYNLTATPTAPSTFISTVTFGCGLPDATFTCTFYPSQIAAGSGSTPVQVTITTTGPNPPLGGKLRRQAADRSPWLPIAFPLAGIVMVTLKRSSLPTRFSLAALFFCMAPVGALVACGGGNSASQAPPIAVSLGPGVPANLYPNDTADGWPSQTAQFTATVSNTTNQAVTWLVLTAKGGTIDANGVYTAPTVAAGLPTTVSIRATSVADPSKYAAVNETLNAATIPSPTGQPYAINLYAGENPTTNYVPVTLEVK